MGDKVLKFLFQLALTHSALQLCETLFVFSGFPAMFRVLIERYKSQAPCNRGGYWGGLGLARRLQPLHHLLRHFRHVGRHPRWWRGLSAYLLSFSSCEPCRWWPRPPWRWPRRAGSWRRPTCPTGACWRNLVIFRSTSDPHQFRSLPRSPLQFLLPFYSYL